MPDWTERLTGKEQAALNAVFAWHDKHKIPREGARLPIPSQTVVNLLRTVATLRALVEEKDKALSWCLPAISAEFPSPIPTPDMESIGTLNRTAIELGKQALALTEEDMWKRLEEK